MRFLFIFLITLSTIGIRAQEELIPLLDAGDSLEFSDAAVPCKNYYGSYWRNDHIRVGKITPPAPELLLNIFNDQCSEFVYPVKGKLISPYGMRHGRPHTGCDIKLNHGDTVRAAFSGIVRLAKVYSGYGNMVVIRHYNGLETGYGHLSKILVDANQSVKAGDPIGLGGRTGRATTDHLHFETRFLLDPFNPEILIDFNNFQLKTTCLRYTKNKIENVQNFTDTAITKSSENIIFSSTTEDLAVDKENENDSTTTQQSSKYHIVKLGDTLFSLAKK